MPVAVGFGGKHELIGHTHGVVGVLKLDRLPRLSVHAHVVAHLTERPGLLFLSGLAVDELVDVGVVAVEHDHLRGAARRATALDRTGTRISTTHERNRSGGGAAARQQLLAGTHARKVQARSRTTLEDHAFLADPREDRLHLVLDRQDETRRALGVLARPDVEPHWRVAVSYTH